MKRNIVGSVEVGSPKFLSEAHTLQFTLHNFADSKEFEIKTSVVPCHGFNWGLSVFPGGNEATQRDRDESGEDYTPFSVYLECEEQAIGQAMFSIRSNSVNRTVEKNNGRSWGWLKFSTRENILQNDLDSNGALRLFVDLQLILEQPPIWKPKKRLCTEIGRLYQSSLAADIEFLVQGTTLKGHRLLLLIRCPTLLDLVDKDSENQTIEIDADAGLFELLLQYLYTEEIPSDFDWNQDGIKLVEVADRFGCTDLKLFAESKVVELGFDLSKAAELLLFAEGHSCALLKEACLCQLAANPKAGMATEGWAKLKECGNLLHEVMQYFLDPSGPDDKSVTELRNMLTEAGVDDLDGSKQMLEARLIQARSDQD